MYSWVFLFSCVSILPRCTGQCAYSDSHVVAPSLHCSDERVVHAWLNLPVSCSVQRRVSAWQVSCSVHMLRYFQKLFWCHGLHLSQAVQHDAMCCYKLTNPGFMRASVPQWWDYLAELFRLWNCYTLGFEMKLCMYRNLSLKTVCNLDSHLHVSFISSVAAFNIIFHNKYPVCST